MWPKPGLGGPENQTTMTGTGFGWSRGLGGREKPPNMTGRPRESEVVTEDGFALGGPKEAHSYEPGSAQSQGQGGPSNHKIMSGLSEESTNYK
jgi:hypothetical protein